MYFRISLFGVPALLVSLAAVGYLRGSKRVWIPLGVALTANAVNLALEITLIYGLGYGVGASAAATVVVQLAAAVVYVAVVTRDGGRSGRGPAPRPTRDPRCR